MADLIEPTFELVVNETTRVSPLQLFKGVRHQEGTN